jgi:hypothetical protein
MTAAGLDPKLSASIEKLPGMSKETALGKDKLNQAAYDALPVGGYYTHPKTGVVMQKGAAPGTAPAPTAAAPPATAAPAATPPPAPVTAPAGSRAAAEDENADQEVG